MLAAAVFGAQDGPPPPEAEPEDSFDDELPLGDLPLPGDDLDLPLPGMDEISYDETEYLAEDEVILPVFGKIRSSDIGLPLFTIAIGLIDGFNPCAMWVLLFLLSILVNLQDRKKILIVAGTFVLVSGIAYFLFMAAWLTFFMYAGMLRWIQILLGVLAVVVGTIHVKDFFAFKKGVSLSIPESAEPTIYKRARQIVTAENLWGALVGAAVLATLVNIVELLCTAGLPAIYTEVLTMQDLPTWKYYAYLGLYILAYMFDDALMVTVVTVTLGKRKMQENEGRWLKLISGLVILILGVVMLFKPDWLDGASEEEPVDVPVVESTEDTLL